MTLSGRDVSGDDGPGRPERFVSEHAGLRDRRPDPGPLPAPFGLIPVVTPTTDIPIFLQRIPCGKPRRILQFIRRMAKRNGYVFHVTPTLPGVNQAVFGPELRASLPQSALAINTITSDNVTSLHFSNDGLAQVGVSDSSAFIEPISKTGDSHPGAAVFAAAAAGRVADTEQAEGPASRERGRDAEPRVPELGSPR